MNNVTRRKRLSLQFPCFSEKHENKITTFSMHQNFVSEFEKFCIWKIMFCVTLLRENDIFIFFHASFKILILKKQFYVLANNSNSTNFNDNINKNLQWEHSCNNWGRLNFVGPSSVGAQQQLHHIQHKHYQYLQLAQNVHDINAHLQWKLKKMWTVRRSVFQTCLKVHNQLFEGDKINYFHPVMRGDALETFRNISSPSREKEKIQQKLFLCSVE